MPQNLGKNLGLIVGIMPQNLGKNLDLIVGILSVTILWGVVIGASCKDNARVDRVENKTAENLCNSQTAEKLLTKKETEQLGREYVCLCQQVAKKSDQNLCETIVNSNNSLLQWATCGENQKCQRIFDKRK